MLRKLIAVLTGDYTPEAVETIDVIEKREAGAYGPTVADGITYDMTVGTHELASLYQVKQWHVEGARGPSGVPDATEVMSLIHHNAQQVVDGDLDAYSARGRMLAINNENFPGQTDLYLYVGSVDNDMAGADFAEDDFFA